MDASLRATLARLPETVRELLLGTVSKDGDIDLADLQQALDACRRKARHALRVVDQVVEDVEMSNESRNLVQRAAEAREIASRATDRSLELSRLAARALVNDGFRDPHQNAAGHALLAEGIARTLRAEGLEDVYHLRGGILKYLEEVPESESLWQGECFVFDERVSLGHGLRPGTHAVCRPCGRPVPQGADCPVCTAPAG